jgi:hypothetical protein
MRATEIGVSMGKTQNQLCHSTGYLNNTHTLATLQEFRKRNFCESDWFDNAVIIDGKSSHHGFYIFNSHILPSGSCVILQMNNESWWRDVIKTWLQTKDIPLLRELERLKILVLQALKHKYINDLGLAK